MREHLLGRSPAWGVSWLWELNDSDDTPGAVWNQQEAHLFLPLRADIWGGRRPPMVLQDCCRLMVPTSAWASVSRPFAFPSEPSSSQGTTLGGGRWLCSGTFCLSW